VSRRLAWTLVSILPLWIVAFVTLQIIAPGGPPPTPKTPAEAAAQYADVSTPGLIAWTLFGSSLVVLSSLAVLWLARAVRGLRGAGIAAGLGIAAVVCGVLDGVATAYLTIGLELSDPPSYLPLVEQSAVGAANAKVWVGALVYGLWAVTVGVVAVIAWREKLLGRAAPVVAVLAGGCVVLAVVAFLPPLLPALLLGVFGVARLRSRQSGSA
jgi:hypothetical protein